MDDNIFVLKEFISINDLQNKNSHVIFSCNYEIQSRTNYITNCDATIVFEFKSEGVLQLHNIDFKPREFPTNFNAAYQKFSLQDNLLIIEGNHSINENIKNYKVIITPYEKIEDL